MSISKKVLSIILTIIMIVTTCSAAFPVFAEGSMLADGVIEDEIYLPEEGDAEAYILSEVTEKREVNSKHFRMSDGSYIVAQYNTPVHYLDENGEWVDIDNTISEAEATTEQTELFGTDELYSTANGAENVVFAEKSNSNTIVSYEAKDYPISFNYQSAKNSQINIIENTETYSGDDAFLTLTDIAQEVLYQDVFDDVDLQYIVSTTGLKENIILKSSSAQNSFTVNYNIGELTAEVVDSNTINLIAEDEVVYTISAPYMTDANGEKSEAVTLTVEKNKNGKLRLVIGADENWLSAEDRAYPVVVDPIFETGKTRDVIDSTMIADASAYRNQSWRNKAETIVGGEKDYGVCRVLCKITLPELKKGEMVVGAYFNVYNTQMNYSQGYTEMLQVNAHRIDEAWDADTTVWTNQPDYESAVADYDIFEPYYGMRSFDITKMVKQWYDEPSENYGLLLKSSVEDIEYIKDNGHKAMLYMERNNSYSDAYPFIIVAYRNNKGLENYWTYTSLSAGGAGAAYINDYTGNLVFATNIISSSNELMPLSVDCVYNGYASNVKYTSGKDGSSLAVPGYGWRLSVQQTLLPTSGDLAENYPYVYTDGDGTDHYIYKNTEDDETVYEDEDGLGLTLTIQKDGSTVTGYTLTDKKDNKLIFNKQGNLIKVENSNGNYNEFVYDSAGKKLQKMIDGAGKEYTVTYLILNGSESDYIDYITDPSDRKIDFSYSNGCLVSVSFAGETVASFTYADSANERSMLTAQDVDGYKLSFEYTAVTGGKQVSYVTEYGSGNALGQKLGFRRDKYNATEIQSAGIDGIYDTNDDLITTYQFDNFGRTITSQLRTKNGTDSVAGVYNYTDNSTASLKTANKVTSSAAMGANVVNLLNGGSCESISGWSPNVNSEAVSTVALSSDKAYIGQSSMLVNNTDITASGGNANAYRNVTGLTAGESYTLSAYVKTEDLVQYGTANGGAYLALRVGDGNGNNTYTYSKYLDEDTEEAINGGWRRISVSAALPAGVTSVRVYTGLKNFEGKAYFDCVQLEKGSIANDYNLITNAGFEKYTDNLPDGWSATSNITSSEGISTVHREGSRSVSIKGEPGKNKFISQYINVYGNPDDTYILSGWAKADAVEKSDNHPDARFQITIQVVYDDGNGGTYTEYKTPAKFNAAIHDWQFTAQTFTLKSEEHPAYQPKQIRVVPVYYHQVNTCYFDNLQLVKDVAQSYVYDSEGNIVSVSANAEQKDNMEYDGEDDLIKYTDVLGNETTYEYDDNHNVTDVTAPGGMKSKYTYFSNGNQMFADIKNSDESLVIRSGALYNEADSESGVKAGAYTTVVSDQNRYRIYYDYDLLRGLVTSVTNPKNVVTTYGYDTQDRLASVTSGNTSVTYSYEGNRLESITYGTDEYEFVYDAYGNVISTKVNGVALSTSNYAANNGVLESTTYGNGDIRSYTYDKYGNLRTVKNANGGTKYSWLYDNSMTVKTHRDAVNTLKYNYSYDAIGRLYQQEILNNSTDEYIGSTQFTYDLRNNVTKISNDMGGRVVNQWNSYTAINGIDATERYEKDNLPIRYTMSSTRYIDYTYDTLNRLTGKTLSLASPLSYAYTYKASARGGSYTTTQIETETIDGNAYSYTYDSLGNITSIKLNGQAFRSYEYDSLNQLIRENNKTDNKTYVYEYDGYGNITAKKIYAYTTSATLGTDEKTISYVYGVDSDAGWKNILKSYNGENIDYDEIGNPITYRGATLDWDTRELKSYSKNGTEITYKYDADGLRASKTVDGVTTTYQYIGNQLMYEECNGAEKYYFYDSNGIISGIRYFDANGNMTMIYVVTNALGDVIALYDKNGNAVVEYQYDAWGNIISTTNTTEGSNLDWNEINPFRYRGYYWDSETELYYLQSRYYDAEVGRFLNADVILDNRALSGINPFTYCGNNPVVRIDSSGTFLELLWDVVSFACSVKEVIEDPTDLGAWGGAILDGVDILVPCFGGFGEAYDIYRAVDKVDDAYDAYKAIDTADDVHDAVKAADNLDDTYDGIRTASDFSGGACFIAGTSVFTENGYKNIENIKPGDKVWATNPETRETELKKVVRTFVNETNELVYVYVNNEEIVTTPEHPFYVSNYGWIGAIDLRAGDRLVLVNGEYAVVEKVQHEILETPIKVYNFEVEDFHTYYVGDTGVLVHNSCVMPRFDENQSAVISLAKEAKRTDLNEVDAKTLWGWAEEYGLATFKKSNHPPMFDSYLNGTQYHMKINGYHINIFK